MTKHSFEARDYALFVDGERLETGTWDEVLSPYDESPVGRVATCDTATVNRACEAAHAAFEAGGFPQYQRAQVLNRAADMVEERQEDLALTIAAEAGKPLKTARVEAARTAGTLRFSAVEALNLTGEMVPMEAGEAGIGKLGYILRIPYGVVGAISPFNFPLNLVAHKLGPSIAAGNATVLKPAGVTPISAIKLSEILYEAGLPENWLQLVCGSGSEVGQAIVESPLTKAITFTGSPPVGWGIRAEAARKKVNLELGSTAPLIVCDDGDWETAADKAQIHAFSHAGQSCISVQRILVHESLLDQFRERFLAKVADLKVGDPMDDETDVGPLISRGDRDRVKTWVDEASAAGATVLAGGELVDEDRCLAPTVLAETPRQEKMWCEEVFGPVCTLHPFKEFDEAIAMANDARFGLQAGIFTRDVGRALEAGNRLEFGGVMVNEVPTFRTDQMPYGGIKDSGNTREGPAYSVLELTEERLVSLQG